MAEAHLVFAKTKAHLVFAKTKCVFDASKNKPDSHNFVQGEKSF